MEIKDLGLDSEEMSLISAMARSIKADGESKKNLYPENHLNFAQIFLKEFNFLDSLYILLEREQPLISIKIKSYISQFETIAKQISFGLDRINSDNNCFTKISESDNINKFISLYFNEMRSFVTTTFPIGRVVSQYDPDENVGIN